MTGARSRLTAAAATVARLTVTGVILTLVARHIDWADASDRLAGGRPEWILTGFLAIQATTLLGMERWRAALGALGVTMRRTEVIRACLVAEFIALGLPGGPAADAARGWFTWRAGADPARLISAMIVDRVWALGAALGLLAAALPRLSALAPETATIGAGVAVILGAVALLVGMNLDRAPIPAPFRRPAVLRCLGFVAVARRAGASRAGAILSVRATAPHIAQILAFAAFARAFDAPLSPLDVATVAPMIILIGALPISIAGWGPREGATVVGFALFGGDAGTAAAVSALVGLSGIVPALVGAPLWLRSRRGRVDSGHSIEEIPENSIENHR